MAFEGKKKSRQSAGHNRALKVVNTEKLSQINFQIPETLHLAFKIKSTKNGEKMTGLLIKFIEDYTNK